MRAVVYDAPGGPEVLRYADVPDPRCGAEKVLIRVEAISIEGGDLVNRATTTPPDPAFVGGYAAAGVILALGDKVRGFDVGGRVATWNNDGSHAALRAVLATRAWAVPDGLATESAAALPISFGTASHCLFARGHLQSGETVLIQGGAGGVGLAAIQLARRAGARVLATMSGSDRQAQLEALGLHHAIDHRRDDVVSRVMSLTNGRGVDLVIDPVGSTLQSSLRSLRQEGRLIFVGNAGGSSLSVDLWPALGANQTLSGVYMGTQLEKPAVHADVASLLRRAAQGELRVVIDSSFPMADAVAAHRRAKNEALGRVVMHP